MIEGNEHIYKPIDLKEFKELINTFFHKPSIHDKRSICVHTGIMGMFLFDLAMLGCHISIPHWVHTELGKYSKYHDVINIGDNQYTFKSGITKIFSLKHSNIKAYLNRKELQFDIYKGTNYIFSTKTLDEMFFIKLKQYYK